MKQLTRGIINCAALILFGAGMCQAGQTNGAILEIKGTVTETGDFTFTQNVDLVVNDGAIHSGVTQTVPPVGSGNPASNCNNTNPTDQVPTDAYVLQSGAPTGCDPGDIYEGNNLSPHNGAFSFTSPPGSSPSYRFDVTTHYQCAVGENGACMSLPTQCSTGSSGICSADSGFLTVTMPGSSTFTGSITLSGTSPNCGGLSSDSQTFSDSSFGPNQTVVLALAQDSSGCGGFTGTIAASEGQQPVPVGSGGTVHLLQGEAITQDITFPKGTKALTGETITDALLFEDCTTLNATLANGSPGNNPDFSGGSAVPAGTEFIPIAGGSCPLIINQCSGPAGPLPNCKDITVPKGSLITLNSNFTADDKNNPAYLIASDSLPYKFDWANISNKGGTVYVPGCVKPPCGSGGGSRGLNGMEAMADLNQTCQLLTYTFSGPPVLPGDDVQVGGTLKFCGFLPGEQTLFGVLVGTDTLRLEGPLGPTCDPNNPQIKKLTTFPVILWPGLNQPFSFKVDVPSNACHGTSLKVTSVIASGTVNYVVDGPVINVQ